MPPLQVLIEVTVAEVVLNDNLNYGVEYFINSGRTNSLLTTSNIAAIAPIFRLAIGECPIRSKQSGEGDPNRNRFERMNLVVRDPGQRHR